MITGTMVGIAIIAITFALIWLVGNVR